MQLFSAIAIFQADISSLGRGFKDFLFSPLQYLGRWSNLTNIFQMGWNHQLDPPKPPGKSIRQDDVPIYEADLSTEGLREARRERRGHEDCGFGFSQVYLLGGWAPT